jgi:hypothetical protein
MSTGTSLPRPLLLDDGRCLRTLADAGNMVLGLTPEEKEQPRWRAVTGNLITAINSGRSDQISLVTWQIERALTEPPTGSVRLAAAIPSQPSARARILATTASSEALSLLAVGLVAGLFALALP